MTDHETSEEVRDLMLGGLYQAMQQATRGAERRRRRKPVGPQGPASRGLGREGAMEMRRARGIGQFRGLQQQGVPQGAFQNRDAYRASFGHNFRQRHPWRDVNPQQGFSNFSDPSDRSRALGPGHPSDQSRMGFFDREAQLGQMYQQRPPQQQAAPDDLLRRRLMLAQQQRMQAGGGMPLY